MADSIYIQISRYSQPVLIIFGTIGALLNEILFFSRRQLRSTSCSLYFRALSANDFIVLYLVVLPLWYTSQFGDDPSSRFDWYCKIKTYLSDSFYTLSPYFIVLTCFDRLCTSSTNARLRKIATIRIAIFLISAITIFVFLAYSHIPIEYELLYFPTGSTCSSSNPIYTKILSLFLLLFLCIIPPILMIICCSVTIFLLRQRRRRIMPVNQARLRQRDNQLLKMLFIYVFVHIICTVPFTVTYVVLVFGPTQYSEIVVDLFSVSLLLLNANFATSFYIYTLCTPFYRHELYNLVRASRNRIIQLSTHILNVS
jgi:hypothetical protein